MTDSGGIVASDINNTYPDIATLTTATTTTEDNFDRGPASSSNINKNSNIARRLENNIVHESPTAKLNINTKIPTDNATAASATAPSTLTTTYTTAADKSNGNVNVNDNSGNIVRTPSSADSVAQKILLIDSDVFNRIASSPSRRRKPVGSSSGPASPSPRSPLGPNYLSNRLSKGKGIARMDSVLTRASVYSNDDDDGNDTASNYSYASSTVQSPVESASKPVFWGGNKKEPELDEDGFPRRTGAKKYVGQPTEEMMEVMIGETKYSVNKVAGHEQRTSGNWDDEHRPRSGGSSSGGAPLRSSSAAGDGDDGSNRSSGGGVVFLGHGRGLSVGGVEVDFGPTASLSGALGSSPSPSSSSKPVTPQSKQQQEQHSRPGSGTSNIAEGSGGHSNANGMRRRSIAWSPGMVNFTNQQVAKDYNYNSASDGGDEQSLDQQPQEKQPTPQLRQQTTPPKPMQGILPPPRGSSYRHQEKKEGSEEEFDAQSFVTAHVAIAQQKQQQDEVMRQKFLRDQFQHHRSASSSSNLLANVLGAGAAAGGAAGYTPDQRNSRSPSSDPEQQNNGVKLPGGHSRNASSATLPHISRQPSTDLLNGGGSGGNSPIHKQASRMASRELLNARPHSRGNMLNVERPVAVPNVNTSTTAALHSLPPPVTYHQASAPVIPNHQRMNSAFSVPGHGKLSAGEQEYIARSMGAPLLGQNLNTETQKQAPPHAAGLLGVMERRDKERREYRSSMAVKQVLRTRGSILGLNAFHQPPGGQPQPLVQSQMTPRMQTPVPQQQVQHPMQPMIQTQFQPQMQLPMQQQQQPAMTAYGAQQNAFGFGGQHMGQPVQQHYGFYGHQPQQGSVPQNSHQQQLAMVMQQQQQLQQQLQQQQMAMMQQRQMDMMQQQLNSMGMNGMNMQGQRQVSGAWRYG